jgi:hypothetical protein
MSAATHFTPTHVTLTHFTHFTPPCIR